MASYGFADQAESPYHLIPLAVAVELVIQLALGDAAVGGGALQRFFVVGAVGFVAGDMLGGREAGPPGALAARGGFVVLRAADDDDVLALGRMLGQVRERLR